MIPNFLAILALWGTCIDSADTKVELIGIKCIVSGKAVSRDCSISYRKARLYFDCNVSKLEYEANPSEFATKANHQLVVTGQYVQANCPIKKQPIAKSSEEKSRLAGVVIRFCCLDCKRQFDAEVDPSKRIERVFGSRGFENTFAIAKNQQ